MSGERKKIELIFRLGDRIVILGFRNACLELMCGVPRLFGAITMDETLLIVIVSIGGGLAMVCAIVAGGGRHHSHRHPASGADGPHRDGA